MKLGRLTGVDRPPGKIDIPSAWRGEEIGADPDRWLTVLGAVFFLVGVFWGRGYLSGGATFTFLSTGIVLAIFGVALDLIFGPPFGQAGAE